MDTALPTLPLAPRSSPFAPVVPGVAAAVVHLAAAVLWVAVGSLPGGRWLAVHLFTLGALTNLVLVFSQHFARTLTRSPTSDTAVPVAALNAGALMVLVGMTASVPLAVAIGGTIVTAVVLHAYWRLRRMRRSAVGARFGWIVRMYERAHGAFVHGAILGMLLGLGMFGGAWYGAARIAHLHVNVLGWGGLTLLATIVFFGPTILRRQIAPGADDAAARALRRGASALTIAVLLLLLVGLPGAGGQLARMGAALGVAGYAWAVTVVSRPLLAVARESQLPAAKGPVLAVAMWFPVLAWADVAIVASGSWHYLDALGLALILGVLLQSIAAALVYVVPLLFGTHRVLRDRLRDRLATGGTVRAVLFNLGVVTLVASATTWDAAVPLSGHATTAGWVLVTGALLQPAVVVVLASRQQPERR